MVEVAVVVLIVVLTVVAVVLSVVLTVVESVVVVGVWDGLWLIVIVGNITICFAAFKTYTVFFFVALFNFMQFFYFFLIFDDYLLLRIPCHLSNYIGRAHIYTAVHIRY